jgi:hypothetical protein
LSTCSFLNFQRRLISVIYNTRRTTIKIPEI